MKERIVSGHIRVKRLVTTGPYENYEAEVTENYSLEIAKLQEGRAQILRKATVQVHREAKEYL